jgi:hypothetical protein
VERNKDCKKEKWERRKKIEISYAAFPVFVCLCVLARAFIIHLKTKRRLLYLKTQSVPRSKHFSPRL